MSTSTPPVEAVRITDRRPRSSILIGAESIISPKTGFVIGILPDDAAFSKQVHQRTKEAEAGASDLMSGAAAASLDRAERYPNSSVAWIQAGFTCLVGARHADAKAAFERALTINPGSRDAALGVARAEFELGDAENAVAHLKQLATSLPNDTEVAVSLAVVLTSLQRIDEAFATIEGHAPVGAPSATLLAMRGSLRLMQGKLPDAISDLRKATRLKPDWVHARNLLGLAELKDGNPRRAEQHFREVIRIAPLHHQGFLNLVRTMIVQKRFEDALRTCEDRYSPATATAAVGTVAGVSALELGKWRTAHAWLSCAIEKAEEPDSLARLHNDLGCAYSRLGQQDEAGRHFEASLAARSTELAILNRAKTYLLQGVPSLAVVWLNSAAVGPEGPSFARRRLFAQSLSDAGNVEAAIELALELCESPQADADVFLLATALLADEVGDYQGAAKLARSGLGQFPENVTLLNNLAYALLMGGDVDGAEKVLEGCADKESLALTATRGLLALKRGDLARGRALYEQALGMTGTETLRNRIRAKRDLEIARAILQLGGSTTEATKLLGRASKAGQGAMPYQRHAEAELRRLKSGDDS